MTPLDYYLWGAIKYGRYADKPETIDALKDNICDTIGEIQLHTIDNEQGEAVTVNGDRYGAMLHEILFTKIKDEDIGNIGNIWFQQDSTTCYTAEVTLDVLCPVFEDRMS